jgi:hypothetical protein
LAVILSASVRPGCQAALVGHGMSRLEHFDEAQLLRLPLADHHAGVGQQRADKLVEHARHGEGRLAGAGEVDAPAGEVAHDLAAAGGRRAAHRETRPVEGRQAAQGGGRIGRRERRRSDGQRVAAQRRAAVAGQRCVGAKTRGSGGVRSGLSAGRPRVHPRVYLLRPSSRRLTAARLSHWIPSVGLSSFGHASMQLVIVWQR